MNGSCDSCVFGEKRLEYMSNGHSRWDAMRIDEELGNDSIPGEGKIFLSEDDANGSFLSVPGSKLITDLRNVHLSDFDFGQPKPCLILSY